MFSHLFTSDATAKIQAEAALKSPRLEHQGYHPFLGIGERREDFGLSRTKAPDNKKVAEAMVSILAQHIPEGSKEKARLEDGYVVAPTSAFDGARKTLSDRGVGGIAS